jgi:ABC-2 type transport system permease protein
MVMVVPALILGVLFPFQTGSMWVESPLQLASWVWVPLLMVATMIADSFAGERERHTLETLLASRLSDDAILFGKIIAAMGIALAMTYAIVILGLLTVNITHWEGEPIIFSPKLLGAGIALSALVACLAASAGVLVSLRAATVRQAQQTLSFVIIAIAFLPSIAFQMLPVSAKKGLTSFFDSAGATRIIVTFFALLIIIDLILIKAARFRFRRTKLLLD